MGKGKKAFISDKKNAQRFRLVPASCVQNVDKTEAIPLSKEQLDEQHKYGIFFDDNYDYLQHLKDRNEGSVMLGAEEVRTVVKAPSTSINPTTYFHDELQDVLEGNIEASGDLEDDFIALAGGVVEDTFMNHRSPRNFDVDSDDEEDSDDFNKGYEDYDDEGDREETEVTGHDIQNRDVDAAFNALLEADYDEDRIGELDPEEVNANRGMEPSDDRVRQLIGEKRSLPKYDGTLAKQYVKERIKYLETHADEEMEEVVVEVPCSKKMKWDCESFATQNSSIFNRPSLIKESSGRLSKKALQRLGKESIREDENEETTQIEEEEEGSVCNTMSLMRRRGESKEERKARKEAVKEARRIRREEKGENKRAFAVERRRVMAASVGVVKALPIM